ncbi:MAG TPA: serine/threonine-protein kinase [Kofleriaceae bacterium]|nr:serine/threonine-protein kinase [Kofleriaceae bacterium]
MAAGDPKDDVITAPYTRQEVGLYGDRLGEGALVGGFLIDELVAEGGCGAVYRAREMASGERVAIKVLHRNLAADGNMVKRFRREAQAVQRIGHPGVVAIREIGALHDGRPYCAMEWLDGHDLAIELGRRGRLSPGEILEIAEQVGASLAAAHACGVVHRDVKAANVMVRRDGEAISTTLIDFGIAKWAAPGEQVTVTFATLLGTPQAMAPEQIRGEPVDARTDVYAFGVLLFQLATGRFPFQGSDAAEIEEQHLVAPPPRPGELAPLPPRFDAVVARALAKSPADRHQDMAELLADLRAALGGEGAVPAARACVAVLVAGDEDTDDDLLDRAADALRAAGMTIALDLSNAVLAVLPGDSEEERRRALACALALCRPGLSVAVHAAAIDRDRPGSGPLFQLAQWPAARRDRVAVSSAAAPAERPADPRVTWC